MEGSWKGAPSPLPGSRRLALLVSRLLDHSLLAYILVLVASKTWLVLNSDIVQLVRRVP